MKTPKKDDGWTFWNTLLILVGLATAIALAAINGASFKQEFDDSVIRLSNFEDDNHPEQQP